MHRYLAVALAAVVIGAAHDGPANAPAASFHVSEAIRAFHPQVERHQRGACTQVLIANIWYPVDISVPEVSHNVSASGRSPFRIQPSAGKAPITSTQAQRPPLLLSRGTGGTASSPGRMAAALVANSYIVAGVNHPDNAALESLTRDGFMLWQERVTDVSEVLDGALAGPVLGAHIDRTRIDTAGFLLGGYTVLELAGAHTDVPTFIAFCGSPQVDAIRHSPEMVRAQINPIIDTTRPSQAEAPLTRSGASRRDAHIKAVFAMAPALGMVMNVVSLGNISIPVLLVVGDADIAVFADTNVRRVVKMLPRADLLLVPGASHYTFMDTCLPEAAPHVPLLCKDNPGVDRDTVHTEAVHRVLNFFGVALSDQT